MENTDKKTMLLWRMAISVVIFFVAGLVIAAEPFRTITYIAAIVILILDFRPARSIEFFEQLTRLFIIAGVLLTGRPSGAFAVAFFYQAVRYISWRCTENGTKPMDLLAKLWSNEAFVQNDGEYIETTLADVKEGDIVVVKAGERIPVDGIVVTGDGFMDMRAFTGESAPREVHAGDTAISGAINFGSTLYIRVTRASVKCAADMILTLTGQYDKNPARSQSRLMRIYNTFLRSHLSASALLLLFALMFRNGAVWVYWFLTAAAVLSLHPLVSSVMLSFASAISGAGIDGVLFAGGKFIEQLAKSKAPENELVINAKDPALAVEETITTGKTAVITDEPRLDRAVSCAKRTVNTVRMSMAVSLLVKLAVVVLAISGHIGIWGAAAADSLASIAILSLAAHAGKRTVGNKK